MFLCSSVYLFDCLFVSLLFGFISYNLVLETFGLPGDLAKIINLIGFYSIISIQYYNLDAHGRDRLTTEHPIQEGICGRNVQLMRVIIAVQDIKSQVFESACRGTFALRSRCVCVAFDLHLHCICTVLEQEQLQLNWKPNFSASDLLRSRFRLSTSTFN